MGEKFLFATTGIRGSSNKQLTPEYCTAVGRAVASWKKHSVDRPNILLAMDTRISSPMIITALTAGLASEGIDITVLQEPIPTPELVFLTVRREYSMGIIVTGSHLPPSDNGIILIDGDGSYFKGTLETPDIYVPWDQLGHIEFIQNTWDSEWTRSYRNHLLKTIEGIKIEGKVLMDSVHGPMREYLYEVLSAIFSEVYTINHEDDDYISGRPSEPKPETLGKTIEYLHSVKPELGIATDLDGDRVIFITDRGEVLPGDLVGAIFAIHSWKEHPEKEVVIPINTSAIIPTLAKQYGGKYFYTKVGAPSIIEGIKKRGAFYGFEETGKYFFNPDSLYPDGAFSSIVLLKIMYEEKKTLSEIAESLPKFFALKTKTASNRKTASKSFATILQNLDKLYSELPKNLVKESVSDIDGIRINFEDRPWILIRQSGTEDNLRVFTESMDEDLTKRMNEITLNFVREYL